MEANPHLVERGQERFAAEIASGRLTIVNAAISTDSAPVELTLSGDDLGASSMFTDRVAERRPIGSITARGLPIRDLMKQYGVPDYLKVDIEGADRFCILHLTRDTRPRYLSFEIGPDVEELVEHVRSLDATVGIFFVASDSSPDAILTSMRAGANEFFAWPPSREAVDEGLKRTAARRASSPSAQLPAATVAFFGAKGGAGTTTMAVNFAVDVVRVSKKRTVIVDIKPGLGGIELVSAGQRIQGTVKFEYQRGRDALSSRFALDAMDGLRIVPSTFITNNRLKVSRITSLFGDALSSAMVVPMP